MEKCLSDSFAMFSKSTMFNYHWISVEITNYKGIINVWQFQEAF